MTQPYDEVILAALKAGPLNIYKISTYCRVNGHPDMDAPTIDAACRRIRRDGSLELKDGLWMLIGEPSDMDSAPAPDPGSAPLPDSLPPLRLHSVTLIPAPPTADTKARPVSPWGKYISSLAAMAIGESVTLQTPPEETEGSAVSANRLRSLIANRKQTSPFRFSVSVKSNGREFQVTKIGAHEGLSPQTEQVAMRISPSLSTETTTVMRRTESVEHTTVTVSEVPPEPVPVPVVVAPAPLRLPPPISVRGRAHSSEAELVECVLRIYGQLPGEGEGEGDDGVYEEEYVNIENLSDRVVCEREADIECGGVLDMLAFDVDERDIYERLAEIYRSEVQQRKFLERRVYEFVRHLLHQSKDPARAGVIAECLPKEMQEKLFPSTVSESKA